MVKNNIFGVILLVIIGLSFIIIIPIPIFLIKLSSYSILNRSYSYRYEPSTPSPIEKLYINADEANIEIRYIDPEVDYYSMIEVNLMMSGVNLARKSYADYFKVQWDNSSSPANFTIEIISDDWYNPSLWAKKELNIFVNLRKDIIFDIFTTITNGNLNMIIPYGVSLNKLETDIINGNVFYDFNQCALNGNISTNIDRGDFKLKLNDLYYTQNVNWYLNNNYGDITLEIYQSKEMGFNISGEAILDNGILNLTYIDDNSNVGALFNLPLSDWFITGATRNIEGFTPTLLNPSGYILRSNDYPAKSNYNFLFNITGHDIISVESH